MRGVADDGGERSDALALSWARRINTSAAAPSDMEDAFAAGTVPFSRKAGFSVGIFSSFALPGCSSRLTTNSDRPAFTVTAMISASIAPASIAFRAQVKDVMA